MSKRTSIPGRQRDLYRELAALDVDGLARRVRQMAAADMGERTISELTHLSVEQVRRILAALPHGQATP